MSAINPSEFSFIWMSCLLQSNLPVYIESFKFNKSLNNFYYVSPTIFKHGNFKLLHVLQYKRLRKNGFVTFNMALYIIKQCHIY